MGALYRSWLALHQRYGLLAWVARALAGVMLRPGFCKVERATRWVPHRYRAKLFSWAIRRYMGWHEVVGVPGGSYVAAGALPQLSNKAMVTTLGWCAYYTAIALCLYALYR